MSHGTKTYFLSDLHLGARYLPNAKRTERTAVRFLESIADDADSIYLVGDILDYWYEYRTVVPRGHIRFFGALARLADKGVKIYWILGNHDIWLFDYLRDEIGITIIDGSITPTIQGKQFFISHGDGLGDVPMSFKILRGLFRNKICQRMFELLPPRLTIPFAYKWSSRSRNFSPKEKPIKFRGEQEILTRFARKYLSTVNPDIDFFIFGHRHVMVDYPLNDHSRLIMLGEWIHYMSYAVFDGEKLELRQFESQQPTINTI